MINSTENQSKNKPKHSTNAESLNHVNDFTDFKGNIIQPDYLWRHKLPKKLNWIHQHNHLEIGRCVKGSGLFFVDENVHFISEGSYFIFYQGQYHSAKSDAYSDCECNFMYIDLNEILKSYDTSTINLIKGLQWGKYTFKEIFTASEAKDLASIIDALFVEAEDHKENKKEIVSHLVIALLTCHSRYFTKNENERVKNDVIERLSPAINYVNENYRSEITVKQLAEVCFTSIATLRRDFSAFFGKSPLHYINEVRIKNALLLIKTTDKKLIDIAFECGFNSISSFNRQFKAIYNCPPSQLKN